MFTRGSLAVLGMTAHFRALGSPAPLNIETRTPSAQRHASAWALVLRLLQRSRFSAERDSHPERSEGPPRPVGFFHKKRLRA